jgi:hypothetical protein
MRQVDFPVYGLAGRGGPPILDGYGHRGTTIRHVHLRWGEPGDGAMAIVTSYAEATEMPLETIVLRGLEAIARSCGTPLGSPRAATPATIGVGGRPIAACAASRPPYVSVAADLPHGGMVTVEGCGLSDEITLEPLVDEWRAASAG